MRDSISIEDYEEVVGALNAKIARLEALARAVRDSDPDDMAADGVTCLMVWKKEAADICG